MPKSRLLVEMVAAAILVSVSFASEVHSADAIAQITRLERRCAIAGVAGTVDKAMECFDTSDDLVAYDVFTPREFDGWNAVRRYYQNYFGSGVKNAKIAFIRLRVVTDGKLGFTHSIQHFTAVDRNGRAIDAIVRVTDVWRKQNGTWKIILTHASFPVDPATFKADLQSKP